MIYKFERLWGEDVVRPLASGGSLCRPVPACAVGLDPLYIKISDSGGLDLDAGGLDAGCWQDLNGLVEVAEVTEGIGMAGGDWKDVPHARASGARRI